MKGVYGAGTMRERWPLLALGLVFLTSMSCTMYYSIEITGQVRVKDNSSAVGIMVDLPPYQQTTTDSSGNYKFEVVTTDDRIVLLLFSRADLDSVAMEVSIGKEAEEIDVPLVWIQKRK